MRKFALHIIILISIAYCIECRAQESDPQKIIESILESHLKSAAEGRDVALIIEDLENLAENPVNINATNPEELSRLYVLNEIQIHHLLNYINEFGPCYSIYELQTISGFSKELLIQMQPFIYFGSLEQETKTLIESIKYSHHQLLARGLGYLQESAGYKPNDNGTIPFEGNRFRYYIRYAFEASDKISAGFTFEKDPGEAFLKGSNKHGFDYNSAHLSYNFNKTIKNITVGDFIVRSGQGLVLWQGYTSGKSENVLGISKNGQGIRPYTSVDENFFFRGLASTLQLGNASLIVFYSNKKKDGNIASNDSTNNYFTSLQTSGYHRTANEIEDEKSVRSANIGSTFSILLKQLKLGATFVHQQFDIPYIRKTQLYNLYRFSGTENYTGSIDYLWLKGPAQLFGEAALSKSGGFAVTQGVIIHLNDQFSFSTLFRHFDKDYHALWANTFAEGSHISNETGMYLGTKFLPAKFISISAYSDIYQSKWINYSTAGPARSWDIFAQAEFRFSKRFDFYFRFKNEEKEQKFKAEKLYVNVPERTQKLRLHFNYALSDEFKLKTRFEHVYFKAQKRENGILLFQDFQFQSSQKPLALTARLAWFNTESYDSRIYAYENDILYTFSIPAYFGTGFRTYINFKYTIQKNMDFWLKFGNTHWTDRNSISSGYNLIESQNKTELKLQLRLKF